MASLEVEFCGVKFKNPFIVSSATPTKTADYMRRSFESGAGGIVVKTLFTDEMNGEAMRHYVRPRFTVLQKKGYPQVYTNYSSEFAAEYGPEEWMKHIKKAKRHAEENKSVLIGSVTELDAERLAKYGKMHEDAGCDILETWMYCCPNLSGSAVASEGDVASNPQLWIPLLTKLRESVNIPIYCKIGAENGMRGIMEGARAVKESGISAVTISDRMQSLEVDLETGRPLLCGGFSGFGGPWMRPLIQKFTARVIKEYGLQVAVSGGFHTWQNAVKGIMVGATLVQTCTEIMYGRKGYGAISSFIKGTERYLSDKGYSSLDDIRGKTLDQIRTFDTLQRTPKGEIWAEVDEEKCASCGQCKHHCFYDAITYDEAGIASVDRKRCDGCGLCIALCPEDAIAMKGSVEVFLGDFT
jgi:dihydroorotate dehydrogenase (fumarate)/dihydropyrimidine dehydrogenase (NAD+) subunit PreA